ncbi:MAG: VOC family protein [Gammaproteobacteria bacterium]
MVEMLVNIDVDDLDKAIDFYGRALGLRVGRRLGATIANCEVWQPGICWQDSPVVGPSGSRFVRTFFHRRQRPHL